mgnify:CR=1 FL=1
MKDSTFDLALIEEWDFSLYRDVMVGKLGRVNSMRKVHRQGKHYGDDE